MFEYAAERGAAFVLKTDDEAFVNVPPLVAQLRAVCQDASGRACWGQGVYLGAKATTAGAGRFRNDDFPFNTGQWVDLPALLTCPAVLQRAMPASARKTAFACLSPIPAQLTAVRSIDLAGGGQMSSPSLSAC